jgi:outer membrane protein
MQAARLKVRRHSLSSRVVAFHALVATGLLVGAARAEGPVPTPAPPPEIDVPKAVRSLTLREALAYAHAHHPAIHAALSRVKERMAEAEIPSGQWLPTVGLSAQLYGMTANNTTGTFLQTPSLDVPRIGATAAATPSTANWSPYPSTFVGAGIMQEIFDFGRIGAQRAAADALVDVAKHGADEERLDIDFGVEEAYFSVLAARAVIVASDDAYGRAKVHRDLAKRGVESGLRPPIELTRAEADLNRFDVGRIKARGGLALAQSVFAAALGAPEPALDVGNEEPAVADLPTMAEAVDLARTRDPVIAQALSSLAAAEKQTRAVGAELRPDIGATGTFSERAGGATASNGAVPTGNGWLPDIPNWDVGLVFSWPLYDGTIAARRDAARSVEQVRHDEVDVAVEQQVANVRKAWVAVQVARSALVALENTVVAARANYDQADARFRAGIGNAVELADAEAVRTDAEIQYALGKFEVARARAAFGRAVAEGL